MKSKELFPPVFSRHALAYQRRLEEIMSRGESLGRTRALELVAARQGMTVIDLACGPGTLSRRLAARLFKAVTEADKPRHRRTSADHYGDR